MQGIGKSVRRVEDRRFLLGRGRYVDDINLARQVYAAIVRSPHAHARIVSVSTAIAERADGVVCVLTGADVQADGLGGITLAVMRERFEGQPGLAALRPLLVADKARFVGDGVALVVADTLAQARDAADLVEVEYQELAPVVDLRDAADQRAPRVHEDCAEGNIAWRLSFGSQAAADRAFASAQGTVAVEIVNNRLAASPIEPRGAVGEYDPGSRRYTLYTSTQNPHGARLMLAAVLGVPEAQLRVVGPDVGGSFGMKYAIHPEDALVLWASRRCGRPVKWVATRLESLLTDTGGRDQVASAEMAIDDEGRILGIRARALHAVGAYVAPAGIVPSLFSMRFIPGPYDVQAIHAITEGVFTNTAPLGPYRGAGRPEATYLLERLVDAAAAQLGLDPAEIRRRNLIRPEALPYQTATGYRYDSGDFRRILDRCLDLADWDGFPARRAASQSRGMLRGRAVSYFIEFAGIFNERMELRFDPQGLLTIVAGTFSHGQGHATTYAQMISDWLGLPLEQIRFMQGDTDLVAFGRGTNASRSSMVGGSALRRAAEVIIEKAKPMAAELLEAAAGDIAFEDGVFRVVGSERAIGLTDVARGFYRPRDLSDRFGVGLEGVGTWATADENFPNGCHVCEVEVDPETGAVSVDRYTMVDDVGRAINPMICEGQICGGLVQGLGQALTEHFVYDPATGRPLATTLIEYGVPGADILPVVHASVLEEIPSGSNPLGVKGVGEGAAVGAPPTVINAVLDALNPLGVEHIDMPATPFRVWEAIERARRRSPEPSPRHRGPHHQIRQ